MAAWRQAARAELAAMSGKDYAQWLLDPVKVYEEYLIGCYCGMPKSTATRSGF